MTLVYLVGAGPGDPGLLTLKGKSAIERADVILFDHLANEALLGHARRDAELLYVGKKKSDHTYAQSEIATMMIERARAGKVVVRLKGGDPFIFGRGGEEAEALADAGVPFEVVPGVTAPLGIAAYSGIPLTHRDHTSAVTFVTGHAAERIDWNRVGLSETLVVYMGLTAAELIAEKLIAAGRDPMTPAIAVRWGTRPEQQTVAAPLRDLASAIARARMKPPATIIVGEVVRLREKLDWFEKLPLFGQRIVVTRAEGQAEEFAAKLRALGADTAEFPVISIVPAADPGPLVRAIRNLGDYDWVVFTSVNAVRYFVEGLDRSHADLRSLRGRICAIGPATRAAVERLHLNVALTPAHAVGEALVSAFASFSLAGHRVLLPRAAVARDVIPVELARLGAKVDVVDVYRNEIPPGAAEQAAEIFARPADWITFTSSSTVKNFLAVAGHDRMARAASIGPATSDTLRKHGIEPAAEADPHTTDALIEAIVKRVAETRAASR